MQIKMLVLAGFLSCAQAACDHKQDGKSETAGASGHEGSSQQGQTLYENLDPVGSYTMTNESSSLASNTLPAPLGPQDVFFASKDQFPVYEDATLNQVACSLNFGDQLLIRDHTEDTLKVRMDAFAFNSRHCPSSLAYGYIKLADLGATPGSGTNTAPGTGNVVTKVTPYTLNQDLPVYATSDRTGKPLCNLSKGNAILEVIPELSIQMLASPSCDPTVSIGYYNYYKGLFVEDLPR